MASQHRDIKTDVAFVFIFPEKGGTREELGIVFF